MIGASSMGAGFGALGNYLAGDEGRVASVGTRNMNAGAGWRGDDRPVDWREAVAEMESRAARSSVARPMYHVSVSFAPEDRPTDAEVAGAVDRTLEDLGLDKHQALVVRHNDEHYEHVHVMVNRVGDDGRVWSPWRERVKLRASMEAQERELGVRWTGKNRGLERAPDRGASQATPEPRVADRAPRDGRGFAAEVRAAALADVKRAETWAEVDRALAAHGWRVERRGQGAVVTDGDREAKLSSVSRTVSRGRLEQRLGPLRAHERARSAPPSAAPSAARDDRRRDDRPGDRPREGGRRRDRTGPVQFSPSGQAPAGPGRPRTRARPPSLQVRARRAARAASSARALGRAVGGEGGEVDPARVAARAATGVGRRVAASAAYRAGRRAGPRAPSTRPEAPRAPTDQPLATRPLASRSLGARAVLRDLRPGGRVDRLAALVAERRAAGRAERLAREATGAQMALQIGRARVAQAWEARARETSGALDRALRSVYAAAPEARRAFAERAGRDGLGAAVAEMARRPETYGPLRVTERPRALGLLTERTTGPARAAAAAAARAAEDHGRAAVGRREAGAAAEAVRSRVGPGAATGRVADGPAGAVVRREARAAEAVRGSGPLSRGRAAELDRAIGRLAGRVGRVGRGAGGAAGGGVTDGRVGRALEARVGRAGVGVAARAARAVERGVGRE